MTTLETYPRLTLADADFCLNQYVAGLLTPQMVANKVLGKFSSEHTEQAIEETLIRLHEIAELVELNGQKNAQEFHKLASVELHKSLKGVGIALRDPDFWRWVNFMGDAYGASLVDLRYGNETPGSAQSQYYGIGRNNQGLISSLWLRADITFEQDSSDPYSLCNAISDLDFWWSHVIRLSFSSCRNMTKAFVKFISENDIPRGDTKDLNNTGFRDLEPELVRRFATTAFELMDQQQAYHFIEKVWEDRDRWKILR
jgi:hypothetical protein